MADNWEYHQDARDRGYAYDALLVLGTVALGVAELVVLLLMQIWQP